MKFLAQLQNPPREFTAIPFWFLNGELTAEELRRQLADFAAHGIYGVVLHPRMGLSPDITYLGERYFALIRTAVEAAAAIKAAGFTALTVLTVNGFEQQEL